MSWHARKLHQLCNAGFRNSKDAEAAAAEACYYSPILSVVEERC
jgi:hypothetical protein